MPGDRLAKAKSKGKAKPAKPAPSAADVAPPDVLGENAVDRGHLQAVREALTKVAENPILPDLHLKAPPGFWREGNL